MATLKADFQLDASNFIDGIRKVDQSVRGVQQQITGFVRSFAAITAAAYGASKIIGGIASSVKSLIGAASQVEDFRASFETLLGSATAARARIAELARFAATTPFELGEVTRASIVLQSLTHGMLATGDGLRMVGDIAAATGQPFEELATQVGRLYDALQTGRAAGLSLNRLQQLGVISGDVRNKIEDLQKSGKRGNEVWAVAAKEFARYGGQMERVGSNWTGVFSNFQDNLDELKRVAGQPIIDTLKPFFEELSASAEKMVPAFMVIGEGVAAFIKGCIGLARVLKTIAPVLVVIGAAALGMAANLAVTTLATNVSITSFAALGVAAQTAAIAVANASRSMLIALGPIGVAIAALTAGLIYFANEYAKLKSFQFASGNIQDERQVSIDKFSNQIVDVASENARADAIKSINAELAEVEKRIRSVDNDFADLKPDARDSIRSDLEAWAKGLGNLSDRAKNLSGDVITFRAQTKQAAEEAERAARAFDEIRQALPKGVAELEKMKSDDAFGALSPIDKMQKLLSDSGVSLPADLDRKIAHLDDLQKNNALTDDQVTEFQQLLENRKQLISVEREITNEMNRQTEQAVALSAKRDKYRRDDLLEMKKMQAKIAGDESGEKDIDRQQRFLQYREAGEAAGLPIEEAIEAAWKKVDLEDKASAVDNVKKSHAIAETTQRIGLGGVAVNSRQDPLVRAQQESTRETKNNTNALEKLREEIRTSRNKTAQGVAIFGV